METKLRLGAETLTVGLTADGEGFAASVDGERHRVAALAVGPRIAAAGGATVEELALEVDGRALRAIVARTRDRVLVALAGRVYEFETGEAARGGSYAAAGSGLVSAPMPGKVTAVLVAVGEQVAPGQALVIVEAMKMETTLAAEVAGCVSAVRAVAGQLVDAGAVVVEITPDAA